MFERFVPLFLSVAIATLSPVSVSADPRGVALSEFPVENRALIEATMAFFDEVEERETPRTRVPVIGLPVRGATKAKAETGEAAVLTRMGPVDHLTGYRITWYPVDRLLGTVDFMGTWNGNRNLVCGYLTWDLSDPEAPRLDAVRASFLDLGELERADAVDIHGSLMEANCAFGAIDENFRVFDVTG